TTTRTPVMGRLSRPAPVRHRGHANRGIILPVRGGTTLPILGRPYGRGQRRQYGARLISGARNHSRQHHDRRRITVPPSKRLGIERKGHTVTEETTELEYVGVGDLRIGEHFTLGENCPLTFVVRELFVCTSGRVQVDTTV